MVSTITDTYTVTLLGSTLHFVIVNGKLSVEGDPHELTPSESKDYPAAAGWFTYAANSYINISPTDIQVAVLVNGHKVPVVVDKPKPLPQDSKYFLRFCQMSVRDSP